MRAGTQALSLLAVPLNVHVLRSLSEGPLTLSDLRRTLGHPPVTTMRSYLRRLTDLGIIERRREDDFPGSVSYAIANPGRKLMAVSVVLEKWLETSPDEPVELGSIASKSVIKALIDGWEVGLLRVLAARPLALTELDRLILQVSYPALERRLTAMRQVGLVEPDPEANGRVARCRVTPWLRQAVAPLSAAVGWERQCMPDQAPAPSKLDIEATLLLAVPLLDLPSDVEGTCRLVVEFRRDSKAEFAGVMLTLQEGKIHSCVTQLEGDANAWAAGSLLDWFRWLRAGDGRGIEIGGSVPLVHAVEKGFGNALMPMAGS